MSKLFVYLAKAIHDWGLTIDLPQKDGLMIQCPYCIWFAVLKFRGVVFQAALNILSVAEALEEWERGV